MKLSIIIPYYNAEKYFFDTFESLSKQELATSDYEVLVVNDGSTENVDAVRDYCEKHENFSFITNEHGGISKARNYGIAEASGEFLFFCDADDRVIENSLCDVLKDAHERKLDMLFFNRFIAKENNSTPPSTVRYIM